LPPSHHDRVTWYPPQITDAGAFAQYHHTYHQLHQRHPVLTRRRKYRA
jgi:hypothetical protein